jgi:hypothetical protein
MIFFLYHSYDRPATAVKTLLTAKNLGHTMGYEKATKRNRVFHGSTAMGHNRGSW